MSDCSRCRIEIAVDIDALAGVDMDPLVCIGCVRRVDALSDEAAGWVLVPHSVADGDDHDDSQWKCPACATASDEFFGDRLASEGEAESEDELEDLDAA